VQQLIIFGSDSHSAARADALCTLPRVLPFPTRFPACSLGLNGLTANNRWHRIYRSQQRSLSLGKGLMHTNRRYGKLVYDSSEAASSVHILPRGLR